MKKIIFIFLSTVLVFCSSPSDDGGGENNSITLSGKVHLVDKADHSGVKINLYNLVEIDTALAAINQKYPQIGVQLTQETEFDHRRESAIKTAESTADGSFQLTGIEKGTYHIVFEADSFSLVYKLDQDLSSSKNMAEITMKPALYLSGALTENWLVENQTIISAADLAIPAAYTLTIKDGVRWFLGDNVEVIIHGALNFENQSKIFIKALDDHNPWNRINVFNTQEMKNSIIENSLNGLRCSGYTLILNDCILRNHQNQAILYKEGGADSLVVEKVIFNANDQRNILVENTEHVRISGSVILGGEYGLEMSRVTFTANNNLFQNNIYSIRHEYGYYALIEHNEFKIHKYGISGFHLNPRELYFIRKNTFNNTGTTTIGLNQYMQNMRINYNNFDYEAPTILHNHADSIDATNNYWGIAEQTAISQKIVNVEQAKTTYIPFLNEPNQVAGIQ